MEAAMAGPAAVIDGWLQILQDSGGSSSSSNSTTTSPRDAARALGFEDGLERLMAALEPNEHRLADIRVDGTLDPKLPPAINAMWHKVYVYCSSPPSPPPPPPPKGGKTNDANDASLGYSSNCTNRSILKAVLLNVIFNGITGIYTVTVTSDQIDPLFIEYIDPTWLESQAPPSNIDCPGWSSFNVFVSTLQPRVYGEMKERWRRVDGFRDQVIAALNRGSKGQADGVNICDVLWVEEKMWVIPPSLEHAGTYDVSRGGIGPVVAITQEGLATPVSMVKQGEWFVPFF